MCHTNVNNLFENFSHDDHLSILYHIDYFQLPRTLTGRRLLPKKSRFHSRVGPMPRRVV
jgi:hypothetical protein